MNRKEKVMKRLQEHYDYLADQGHEIVFSCSPRFLQL